MVFNHFPKSFLRNTILVLFAFFVFLVLWQGFNIFWFSHKGKEIYTLTPFQRINPKAKIKILFLGDSTAVGTGAKSNLDSTAGRLAKEFPKPEIINIGKVGQKIGDLLDEFYPSTGMHYHLIIVQIGANDIMHLTPIKKVKESLFVILDRAKNAADAVIILHGGNIGTAPIFIWPFNDIYTTRTRMVRAIYKQIAKEKGALYIDLFQERKDDLFLKDIQRFYAPDLLHPSGDGYGWWYEQIRATLAKEKIVLK